MQEHRFTVQPAGARQTVLTIGNFDGVHLGHQALLRRVVNEARAGGCASAVITFDPHPQQVLREHSVPVLSSLPLRLRLFEALGLDAAYVIPFTRGIAALSAGQFLHAHLLNRFAVRRLVIGYDFAFGRNRDGTAAALERMSQESGFELEIFPAVQLGEEVVSSTRIRRALAEAEFATAARYLGRPYAVLAPVERGDQLGRKLGFPTLNQPARDALPIPYGIYASRVVVGEREYDGASSYGVRPTLEGDGQPILETHLFDFQGDLYDQLVEVRPLQKLRDEQKFDSLDELKAQIAEDCRQARDILDTLPR